jgi:hypothetical protein
MIYSGTKKPTLCISVGFDFFCINLNLTAQRADTASPAA